MSTLTTFSPTSHTRSVLTAVVYPSPSLPTRLTLQKFSSSLYVSINQTGKVGNVLRGYLDSKDDVSARKTFYNVECLLGARDDHLNQVYCRSVIEKVASEGIECDDGVVVCVCLREEGKNEDVFRQVMEGVHGIIEKFKSGAASGGPDEVDER